MSDEQNDWSKSAQTSQDGPELSHAPPDQGFVAPGFQPQPSDMAAPALGAFPPAPASDLSGPDVMHYGFSKTGSDQKYRAPGGSITMIVGALITILGTFLPWATVGDQSINGYDDYFFLGLRGASWDRPGSWLVVATVMVIVSAVVVLVVGRRMATWISALLVTALTGLVAFAAHLTVFDVVEKSFNARDLSLGAGIILCALGASVAGIGAIIVVAKTP